MPTVCINALCANQTLAQIKEPSQRKMLEENTPAFILGALGGDIFGFYDIYARQRDEWIASLVQQISSNPKEFIDYCTGFLKGQSGSKADTIKSFICGLYVKNHLDERLLPYLTRIALDKGKNTGIYPKDEIFVKADVTLASPFEVREALDKIDDASQEVIEQLYRGYYEKTRREIIPEGMLHACLNILKTALVKRRPLFASVGEYYYSSIEADETFRNAQRHKWENPFNKQEILMLSATDLIGYATRDSAKKINHLFK